MTERKPPGMSIEHWVDKQVREATEGGKFDDLPGAGKPIPPGGIGSEDDWWITQKMAREDLTFTAPTFEIRKAADRLPERVAKAHRGRGTGAGGGVERSDPRSDPQADVRPTAEPDAP